MIEKIRKLYATGMTQTEIGDKLGISQSTVCQLLRKSRKCIICGKPLEKGKHKYCSECYEDKQREHVRAYRKREQELYKADNPKKTVKTRETPFPTASYAEKQKIETLRLVSEGKI